jgi:magnesium transporter
MIEFTRYSKGKLVQIERPEKNCWINLTCPTQEELNRLKEIIVLPEEVILSLQDKDEMPTLEDQNNHIFIILRTPNKISELRYNTVPLGIIITGDYVITLCFHKNDVLEKFKQHFSAVSKTDLVLRLMFISSKVYLNYLSEINNTIDHIESQIYKSQKNKEITKLLGVEQSLVYFNTSLESNKILLGKTAENRMFNKKEEKNFLSQIEDETAQAIEMTKIYTNIMSNLMDAFASMISNNLNIVMKLLTSITILISIPSLIASFYGMNVVLPFQNHPMAFTIVLGMSLMFSIMFLVYFYKHDMI